MSGRSARTIRNFSLELSPNLVLPNVGQVDFDDFRKHWNFNVLEMALKTFRFVQGLPITHFFFFLRYFKTGIFKFVFQTKTSGNLRVWQRRASENNRDLSGQKCFNLRGVLIGDKTDCKTDTWELEISIGNFRMGTLAPGSQAWGTRLLWLGEPVCGTRWNPGGRSPLPGL